MTKNQGYSIWTDARGRLVLSYDAGDGWQSWKQHRIPKHIATEENAAAHRYAKTWLARRTGEAGRKPKQRVIRDLNPEWLAIRTARTVAVFSQDARKLRGQTVTDNESHMRNHILDDLMTNPAKPLPVFGDLTPDEVTIPKLRAWIRHLSQRYAPMTVGNIVASFTGFMDDAIGEGWLTSPFNLLRTKAVRAELPKRVRKSGTEVVRVPMESIQALVHCKTVDPMRRVKYVVGFTGGHREAELQGVAWMHRHKSRDGSIPYIDVRQQFAQKAGKPEGKKRSKAGLTEPKTPKSRRQVPEHPAGDEALDWWYATGWRLYFGRDPTPLDPIFPGVRTGKFARPKSADYIRKDLIKAGCSDTFEGFPITFHATRRSFLSWLAELEVDQEVRGWLAGHTSDDPLQDKYVASQRKRMYEAVCRIPLTWPKDPIDGRTWAGDKRRWNKHCEPHCEPQQGPNKEKTVHKGQPNVVTH